MKAKINFNVDEPVSVTLTDVGRGLYERTVRESVGTGIPSNKGTLTGRHLTCKLWVLMAIFGSRVTAANVHDYFAGDISVSV